MINNRQAGRRRGRNTPRQNGGGNRGNGGDSGNRIDNRARGNAAQLLEKYRNMARDAQLAGDRVNMEYYLQFADHYFRVLADNRARQEENQNQGGQNQQRFRRFDENGQDDEFADDGDSFDSMEPPRQFEVRAYDDSRRERPAAERPDRPERSDRGGDREENRRDRPDNGGDREEGRRDRGPRDEPRSRDRDNGRRPQRERAPVAPQPVEAPQDVAAPTPAVSAPANDVVNEVPAEAPKPRATRARKPRQEVEDDAPSLGLDTSILPPAIGRPVETPTEGDEAPAPRRTRRPRSTPAQAAE
ncbi:MAG TPA: DUF4167 domain-containing protein [Sphingobium sp.]|uniref:DUF4167 domain-containing protein n=1 Tax=Sphingobium sp. TaxID=1912891 RepID=UPI002ECFF759